MAETMYHVRYHGLDLFGEPIYSANVISEELKPTMVRRMIGLFKTVAEAEARLTAEKRNG